MLSVCLYVNMFVRLMLISACKIFNKCANKFISMFESTTFFFYFIFLVLFFFVFLFVFLPFNASFSALANKRARFIAAMLSVFTTRSKFSHPFFVPPRLSCCFTAVIYAQCLHFAYYCCCYCFCYYYGCCCCCYK